MPRMESMREIGRYLLRQKAYWLVPLLIVLILCGLLLIFASSSAVAPFIYTLF
jgi:uncharacterized protein DUF5989